MWLKGGLPSCYDELGLSDQARADAESHVRTMHDWIEGGIEWQRTSARYRVLAKLTEADFPNPLASLVAARALSAG